MIKTPPVVLVWNNRGGIIGDLLVNISFIDPATSIAQPIVRSEIVSASDQLVWLLLNPMRRRTTPPMIKKRPTKSNSDITVRKDFFSTGLRCRKTIERTEYRG